MSMVKGPAPPVLTPALSAFSRVVTFPHVQPLIVLTQPFIPPRQAAPLNSCENHETLERRPHLQFKARGTVKGKVRRHRWQVDPAAPHCITHAYPRCVLLQCPWYLHFATRPSRLGMEGYIPDWQPPSHPYSHYRVPRCVLKPRISHFVPRCLLRPLAATPFSKTPLTLFSSNHKLCLARPIVTAPQSPGMSHTYHRPRELLSLLLCVLKHAQRAQQNRALLFSPTP